MATTEERDTPSLGDLFTEIEAKMADFDARPAGSLDVELELKNTILPLLKDVVASVGFAIEDLQDIVDPIKLSSQDAQEIGTLLAAFREMVTANPQLGAAPQLVERIDDALAAVSDEDDDDEPEGDDEDEPSSN